MGLFDLRKKQLYKVVKLYKIVNIEQAKRNNTHNIIKCCLDLVYSLLSKYPDNYEINYGKKQWKSKKGFESGILKVKEYKIFDFSASFSQSKSYICMGNSILNVIETSIPNKSVIDIEIAIPSSSSDTDKIMSFLEHLFTFFSYDYGYIVELADNFDFSTERKIKKKLFGYEVTIEEIDKIWRFHSVGINHGFLKNIYPVNVLNKSQISQTIINECLDDQLGNLKEINKQLSIWLLNDTELNQVKERFKESKYIIANQDSVNHFLESDEAKQFREEMRIG